MGVRARGVLLLAVLLAGCAAPPDAPLVSAPISTGGTSAEACATGCAREWWNATLLADGDFRARIPIPSVWAQPPPFRPEDAWVWTGAPRVEGDAAARVGSEDGFFVEASGAGDATFRLSALRVAPAGRTADEHLRARWSETEPRPSLVYVDATGARGLVITYEARSELCERRARFAVSDVQEGRLVLSGEDRAWCA